MTDTSDRRKWFALALLCVTQFVLGVAIPFGFVPITIAALAGTKRHEAGLALGLINTARQIGGAVGIAVLSTIAVSTTDRAVRAASRCPSRSPTGS